MNKKILVLLFAGLLLVSAATGCKNNGKEVDGSSDGESVTIQDPFNHDTTAIIGTDTNGDVVTRAPEPETKEPDEISEPNAVFKDVSKTIYILANRGTIRTDTVVTESTACAWPKEGTTFTATGESDNWYRIKYDTDKTCYVAKNIACDAALLEGFTTVDEIIEIANNVNVRSVPSTASKYSLRDVLKKGAKVKRIGVSDKWSMIEYEMTNEAETGADGKPVTEIKHYFISNDCIVTVTESATEPESETAAS